MREYPLILIGGAKTRYFFHSEFRQIESFRKRIPDPQFEIHPDTANSLGIEAEGGQGPELAGQPGHFFIQRLPANIQCLTTHQIWDFHTSILQRLLIKTLQGVGRRLVDQRLFLLAQIHMVIAHG